MNRAILVTRPFSTSDCGTTHASRVRIVMTARTTLLVSDGTIPWQSVAARLFDLLYRQEMGAHR